MTTLTPLSKSSPPTSPPATAETSGISSTAADGIAPLATPASVVTLSAADAQAVDGAPRAPLVWERNNKDAISALVARNYSYLPAASRFKNLGAALLERFKTDSSDYSQSVQQPSQDPRTGTYDALLYAQLPPLHRVGDDQAGLTITTRSGVKVSLALDSSDNGVAVQVKSSGKLSDDERAALAKLSGAFQQAIDGLAAVPPKIDLSGLTGFDASMLSSVDLHSHIKLNATDTQQLDFHADAKQRSVRFNGPTGEAKISVDLSQPVAWGSKEQQAKALANYLHQFDQAASRGHGDAELTGLFKDAFTEMHSNYGQQPAAPQQRVTLEDQDHAILTGLADFSASITQTETSPNPLRLSEHDSFDYQASQSTSVQGHSQLDRSVAQQQQSQLKASYHAPSKADGILALTLDRASQNYNYVLVDDNASSNAALAYEDGALAKATLDQSASQSTRTVKYLLDKLVEDLTVPSSAAHTRDLLDMLAPKKKIDEHEGRNRLNAANQMIFLQPEPGALPK
ncbi:MULTISPECIES: hypothetical protein [unclassified Duganella]|uniref:hypothetical protein n=1 Tax=unclassified Duganella TaxID=2636909 RepID=UPI001E4E4907|nr:MULTISPECIES: hypothetical protein [unclassified Duganella]